jgi:hypothetical protein
MQLDISFDAAEILRETGLRTDDPELWSRYLDKMTVRFGKRTGARVYTSMGWHDLGIIRDYFCLWVSDQELVPAELRTRQDEQRIRHAQQAISALTAAIERHAASDTPGVHATV